MILESLCIDYTVLEGTGRVGGRLFTYRFPEKEGLENFQYYVRNLVFWCFSGLYALILM